MSISGIAGIGTDLLSVARIQGVYERHGERFVQRILGVDEQAVHRRRQARDPGRGVLYLASRFAAKEAFSKAIGLGMRMPMAWSRVQILNQPGGAPALHLAGPLADWYHERFGAAHVSISDESSMVVAFVIVEHRPAAVNYPVGS